MSFIEINNLTKRFDDNLAVDSISLNIEKGEIFGLLGPNGAGKSTLISMLCGLVKPDSGDISIGGYSMKNKPIKVKEFIGLVPQEIALYEKMSCRNNLKFWGSMYGLKGSLLKERIDEALELTGLKDRQKDAVKKFSGGMKRRLNIACAVMHHPEVLIMDEPTVGIDPQSRNHILEFAKNLNVNFGTTVIYTSHYMEEIENLCNNLLILDSGKEIVSGRKDQIKRMVINQNKVELSVSNCEESILIKFKQLSGVSSAAYNDDKITLVTINGDFNIEDAIKLLITSNVKIKNISITEPSLESVFLSLTGKKLRD